MHAIVLKQEGGKEKKETPHYVTFKKQKENYTVLLYLYAYLKFAIHPVRQT
jgi:hypothetical protein